MIGPDLTFRSITRFVALLATASGLAAGLVSISSILTRSAGPTIVSTPTSTSLAGSSPESRPTAPDESFPDASAPAENARADDDAASRADRNAVDFNRDVRPILSGNCFACHGPDEHARAAELRLDTFEGATAPAESGLAAVVPGKPDASELIRRLIATDPHDRMPPAKTGKTLTPQQIGTLRGWIAQGAEYSTHWSFVPPKADLLAAKRAVANAPASTSKSASGAARDQNPIDLFIDRELAASTLPVAPPADRRTLIRRLSLDLTGIPPTNDEVRDFINDTAQDAYERLVDRLLASPRYGERMATDWLDAARFADTHGYHIDSERFMWKWREWVIDSFNENKPFDQFTVEQIAGDMLPADADPRVTERRILASGFNRNHMINFEGGAIPEEYMHNYLVDRVNTTATVWLGLTMSCAQCHDHKYDPITQKDYYRFYAFFNNIAEQGLDGNTGNAAPMLKFPTDGQRTTLESLLARSREYEAGLAAPMPETDAAQTEWESGAVAFERDAWKTLTPVTAVSNADTTLTVQSDGTVLAGGNAPNNEAYELVALIPGGPDASVSALRLEALTDPSLPQGGPGRFDNGNVVLTDVRVSAHSIAEPARSRDITLVNALADYSQDSFPVSRAIDADHATGWATGSHLARADREAVFTFDSPVSMPGGTLLRVRLGFNSEFIRHSLGKFRLSVLTDPSFHAHASPATLSPWASVGPFPAEKSFAGALAQKFGPESDGRPDADLKNTYLDGTLAWTPREDLADGIVHMLPQTDFTATFFRRTINAPTPRRLSISLGSDDAIRLWLNGTLVHEAGLGGRAPAADQDALTLDLPAGRNAILIQIINFTGGSALYFKRTSDDGFPAPRTLARALRTPADQRDPAQNTAIRDHFRSTRSDEWREIKKRLDATLAEHKALDASIPTAMVMKELETPRKTFIHLRGEYDQLGEEVTPAAPHFLPQIPPQPQNAPANRLSLAKWLVDPENPLTARVFVNRLWQSLFGAGLVKTAEDFGLQGQWPSHPELLDYLAFDFVEHGWDIKRTLRLIATSDAYRRAAIASDAALTSDPENRLLSFHPRVRLNAETIRDSALAISGLLVERIGGPSVRPYHPAGLWEEMSLDPTGNQFSAQVYKQDTGDLLYRRTLYVFRKRTVPHPMLAIFDAPNRETCAVRRPRTNTPLQALVTLNETGFVEAARHFAQRVLTQSPDTATNDSNHAASTLDARRLDWAFEAATSRIPTQDQREVLADLLHQQRAVYTAAPDDADKLLAVGESPRDAAIPATEHAAWTIVCSAILNLDQTLVKD